MDTEFTKQLPGERVQLNQQLLEQLKLLDPKKFHREVSFFGGHPFSLVKKDENKIFMTKPGGYSPYLICEKTDGVRYMLIVTNTDHFLISRQGKSNLVVYKTSCKVANNWHRNPWGEFRDIIHILDGEMINDKDFDGGQKLLYLVFDALVVFGKKIIQMPLKKRLEQCEKFVNCNQFLIEQSGKQSFPSYTIQVKLKDFFRLSCNTYVSSESIRTKNLSQPTTIQYLQQYYIKALPHENDGLIINDQEKPYILGRNPGYLKWKPAQLNTVDFLVIPNTKLEGKFEKRVLDLYLGWRDEQITGIYRMIFHNFTVVSRAQFEDLEKRLDEKYNVVFNQNPDLVTEDSFGIIAECKYNKVQQGSEQAALFKQLFSSTKSVEQIHEHLMLQRNEKKELQVIKKIQGQPYTKYWRILRIRKDKNMPNDNDVVFKIEESIKDDIKYQDLVIKNKELFDIKRIQNS